MRLYFQHIMQILLQKTWAPRGAETALVLYNITRGWVTHNEVGIVRFAEPYY